MLAAAAQRDLDEVASEFARLEPELRHAVRSNLTLLSIMAPVEHMPDPTRQRVRIAALLRAFDGARSIDE
jgi:hypothetical protein